MRYLKLYEALPSIKKVTDIPTYYTKISWAEWCVIFQGETSLGNMVDCPSSVNKLDILSDYIINNMKGGWTHLQVTWAPDSRYRKIKNDSYKICQIKTTKTKSLIKDYFVLNEVDIYAFEDDWFVVAISSNVVMVDKNIKFNKSDFKDYWKQLKLKRNVNGTNEIFKCDQWEGVKSLLESNGIIRK